MRTITLSLACAALLTFGGCDQERRHTELAPQFTVKAFETIQNGDSVELVRQKLGTPFQCDLFLIDKELGRGLPNWGEDVIPFEDIPRRTADPNVCVRVYYSRPESPGDAYWLYWVQFINNRVENKAS